MIKGFSGKHHSAESKLKISLSRKGHIPYNKGIPMSDEIKEKDRLSHLGKKASLETKNKMRKNHSSFWIGHKHTEESKKKMGEARKGKPNCRKGIFGLVHWSLEAKKKMSEQRKGKKFSIEHRLNLSKSNCGEKCYLWQGGITPINFKIRNSIDYRLWREAIFARDNWICQKCLKRGSQYLQAHHINNFSEYPELRFAIDNGITFCRSCHKKFHKKYSKKKNNQEQLRVYLNINSL